MTEEQNKANEITPIEKLLIDDTSKFQYHAAFLVYSETFDKTPDQEAKKQLNQNITDLKENKIDLETFYLNISPHRKISPVPRQERFSMQTQRKKDWRMKTQRQDRIKRHKK